MILFTYVIIIKFTLGLLRIHINNETDEFITVLKGNEVVRITFFSFSDQPVFIRHSYVILKFNAILFLDYKSLGYS